MTASNQLSLAEKCAITALFGDVSCAARDRLLSFAEMPESGVLIGGVLSGKFQDGRLSLRVKPSLLDN
jgi:hypothetical protein